LIPKFIGKSVFENQEYAILENICAENELKFGSILDINVFPSK